MPFLEPMGSGFDLRPDVEPRAAHVRGEHVLPDPQMCRLCRISPLSPEYTFPLQDDENEFSADPSCSMA